MKKIVTVIGARPQIIKAAALSRAIKNNFSTQISEVIIHTGQHYDANMSAVFFHELGIPDSNYNLEVGSGSHGIQTAKMIEGIEKILLIEKPDAVLVYGDTNSTLAAALAASKIHIPVIHIEAGLRSYSKSMPEEINRIACDHVSTFLFSPTQQGIDNLGKEGFSMKNEGKASIDNPFSFISGDVMFDNSLHFAEISDKSSTILNSLNLNGIEYVLCTIHRDSNTDVPDNLKAIFKAILEIQEKENIDIVLPLHPRTRKKMEENLTASELEIIRYNKRIQIIDPAGFIDMIALEKNCSMVITDSGGVQKESFFFQKPCIILRPQSEWVEIVENGNAILADADTNRIVDAFSLLKNKTNYTYPKYYGEGNAAEKICSLLLQHL